MTVKASVCLVDEVVGPRGDRHRHLGMAGSLTNSRPFCDDHRRHLVNRYYDPATYQFLSIDPKVATTMQPYAFVDGDPLNETDPLGLTGDAAAIIRYDRAHHDLCGNRGERRCVGIGHRVAHYADEVRHSAAAAGSWAKHHPGDVASFVAIGTCIGLSLGTCAAVSAVALGARVYQRHTEGTPVLSAVNGVDALTAVASFGLLGATSSAGEGALDVGGAATAAYRLHAALPDIIGLELNRNG